MGHDDAGDAATTETPERASSRPGRAPKDHRKSQRATRLDEAATIADLVRQAREDGDELTGPGGLLKRVRKMVLETALEEEMTEHLGHAKHQMPEGVHECSGDAERTVSGDSNSEASDASRVPHNVRNGSRSKTVLTDNVGDVEVGVPRDRAGTFEPVIIPKHQRSRQPRGGRAVVDGQGADQRGDLCAPGTDLRRVGVQGHDLADQRPNRRGDEHLARAAAGPSLCGDLSPKHFVQGGAPTDAIVVKVRDGQVANRPYYAAIGITVEECKEILGLWPGTPSEGKGAEYWTVVLTKIRNRGGDRHDVRRV